MILNTSARPQVTARQVRSAQAEHVKRIERANGCRPNVAAEGAASQFISATGCVLYVEDNPSNVKLVERVLARRPGVRLLVAMRGSEGLEIARRQRPDLVLLDRNLPDTTGDHVLTRRRAIRPRPGSPW